MRLKDNLYLYPEKGALDCNTYVLKDKVGIIIDPGSPQFLSELDIEYLLPGHMGIVAGAEKVKSNFEFINWGILSHK